MGEAAFITYLTHTGRDKVQPIPRIFAMRLITHWAPFCCLSSHHTHSNRASSFPLLADRFSSCLRILNICFARTELDLLNEGLPMLKHFTRLESLKLKMSVDSHQHIGFPIANLPSTLKQLHLDYIYPLVTDETLSSSASSSSASLSSLAEPKGTQFPPQLEELHLVNSSDIICHVLHHMFPTTLVTLQLCKAWSRLRFARDSNEQPTPKHELIKAALKAMPQLKYFALQWEILLPPADLVASLPPSLNWLLLKTQDLHNIHKLKLPPVWFQLRKLALIDSNLKNNSIAALHGCTNLESLDLVPYYIYIYNIKLLLL